MRFYLGCFSIINNHEIRVLPCIPYDFTRKSFGAHVSDFARSFTHQALRTKYKLATAPGADCLASTFCLPCAVNQVLADATRVCAATGIVLLAIAHL